MSSLTFKKVLTVALAATALSPNITLPVDNADVLGVFALKLKMITTVSTTMLSRQDPHIGRSFWASSLYRYGMVNSAWWYIQTQDSKIILMSLENITPVNGEASIGKGTVVQIQGLISTEFKGYNDTRGTVVSKLLKVSLDKDDEDHYDEEMESENWANPDNLVFGESIDIGRNLHKKKIMLDNYIQSENVLRKEREKMQQIKTDAEEQKSGILSHTMGPGGAGGFESVRRI